MTHESTAVGLASAYSNATTASGDWWRDAVIYQVYVRSFADSDGDGIGDLRGVRSRLPHLARLGVDAVWLTPFYVSPQADGGYDVADYRAVDPLFGDLDDAAELVRAAHQLGLRIIVDVVPNHTSEQHPWFRAALAGEPGARERYLFRRGRGADGSLPPNDWESIFGGPAWTRVPDGAWYLHLFAPEQPDLDWTHPEVREEFDSVLRFWLDLGVDGFRIDVAHGMVKAEGLPDIGRGAQATLIGTQPLPFFDQDGVHEIHRSWRRLLDSYEGQRIGVAEAWAPSSERLALYVRPDELHQAFNFRFLTCPWDAEAMRTVIDESLSATTAVGAPTTWVLSNHDVVRHTTRYGGGAQGLARARAAAMLMLSLPGSAYLYQGEELGLPEVADLPPESRQDPAFRRGRRQPIPPPAGEPAPGPGPATPGIIAPRPGDPEAGTGPQARACCGPQAGTGPTPEPQPAPEAAAATRPHAEAQACCGPQAEPGTGAGPTSQAHAATRPQAEAQACCGPQAEAGTGPQAGRGPAPEPQPTPQAHPATRPHAEARACCRPQAEAGTGPQAWACCGPQAEPGTGAGPTSQAHAATRPQAEARACCGPQAGTGAAPEPQPTPEAAPRTAPPAHGTTRPEAGDGAGAESTPWPVAPRVHGTTRPEAAGEARPEAGTGAGADPDLLTAPEADGQDGLRDGCRVPIPWAGAEPPYGFGPAGSWLPQPPAWAGLSVAAQTGDPHSTLELYRAALELRRALPGLGAPEAGGPADPSGMRWQSAPDGVLLFTRPGFACTLNTRPDPVELPAPGRPVLSSAPVETDGRTVRLPADSCTWWTP
ncbi:alpha-amylase family glycosyl hydrolase [Streptomyces amritsarensis]|uniref:alpha-amylase family glycosyl hydrolase n=1 Tax=Streptomyces amritsarensis TaxID=681158 RepID=UPI001F0B156E|nr:alpha-amylase family glycosyl hydrolase [Streptomyces amritsarensis]